MPIRRRMMKRRPRRMPRNKMFGRRRRPGAVRQKIHYFKRTFRVGDLIASYNATTAVTTPINNALSFNLTQLPAYTELTSLYDQYQIKGVRVNIQPLLTEGIASAVSGSTNVWGFPKLSTVIDYDDTAIPADETVYLQYGSLRQTPAFKEHKRYFRPKVKIAGADAGATITANGVRAGQWIDTGVPTVPHFGLKVFHPGPIASGTPLVSSSIAYSVYATLYVACKNVR